MPEPPEQVRARRVGVEEGLKLGLRNRWYPIYESAQLGQKPVGVKRLGEDLALWRDGRGQPHLFLDRCPHRGAAFSCGGTVHGQELQCWYHGFRYDGTGQCTLVPAEGVDSTLPQRVSITSYPVHEHWGLVWAYIGEVDLFPPPPLRLPAELYAPEWTGFIERTTWRASWLLVLDNIADPIHATYLHRNSYTLMRWGEADKLRVTPLEDGFTVERAGKRGVNFDWAEFHDSGTMWFRLDIPYPRSAGPGGPLRIMAWSTPIDEEHALSYFLRLRRVTGWQRVLWRTLYRVRLVRKHWAVLEQDRAILESQRGLSSRLWEHMAQTDVGTVHLRRVLNESYWKQQDVYLRAAAAGRRPTAGERARALLAAQPSGPIAAAAIAERSPRLTV